MRKTAANLLFVISLCSPALGAGVECDDEICLTELLPVETEWLARIVDASGAANEQASAFETMQTFYANPDIGTALPEGNRVVLRWLEDGTVDSDVEVFLDNEFLGSVTPLTSPGVNAIAVSGVATSCTPGVDAGCIASLQKCGLETDREGSSYRFEISAAGNPLDACQEVLSTWPMAENWQITCAAKNDDDDCEIVVEGETIGPPGDFIQVIVDGQEAIEPDGFEEFTTTVAIDTQGDHDVLVRAYRSRESAGDSGLQWLHPETGVVYEGIIGSFVTQNITSNCVTTCGAPPPGPRFLPGDCNDSGVVDLSDAVFGLGFLFTGGAAPACESSCETNGDDSLDISDMVYSLVYLFTGGPAPAQWEDSNGNSLLDDCSLAEIENCAAPLGCES